MTQQQIIYLVFVPIIIWRLYSRMRKVMGRQEAKPWRLWTSVILFPLLTLLMAWATQGNMVSLGALIGGGVCGVALATAGLRLTQFFVEGGKLFYQPNRYIGMGLMIVLVMRIVYRFTTMPITTDPAQAAAANAAAQHAATGPLTMFVIGLLFCYYAPYSAGILMHRAKVNRTVTAADNLEL